MASLSKVNNVYQIMYRLNGKQFKKTIGKVSRTIANKALVKIEEDIALTKLGLNMPRKVELNGFFDEYLQYVKLNQAKKTHTQKVAAIKKFKRFLVSNKRRYNHVQYLHTITPDVIENYKMFRREEGVANRTINIELFCFSNFMKFAEEWGYLIAPMKIKKLPEQRKQPRYLSRQELLLIMDNASNHLKQVVTLFVLTGMRSAELLNLKWEHVDFASNTIKVANTNTFTTKNKKDRLVPMNGHLKQTLIYLYDHYIDQNVDIIYERKEHQKVYVLCNRDGSNIKCIRRAYSRLMDKLNIEGVNVHTLRHTFASHCVLNGVDLLTIKEFLGHSRVTTTEIYTHLNQTFKADAIKKLDGLLLTDL
jgi:site-specific recombinase XerD